MWIKATLMTTALAGIAALGVLAAPDAGAAPAATVPIAGFHELAADVATGHLFFSRGAQGKDTSDTIVVTNLAGRRVGVIGGQTGVEGIALSPDGATLYAALAGKDAVSAINATSLEQMALYPLGAGNRPYDVAFESGRVWVSYGSKAGNFVGDINPNVFPASAFTPLVLPSSFSSAPRLAADAAGSGTLLASVPGAELATIASYDVATSPVTMYRPPTSLGSCEFPSDLAIAPGGGTFVVSCGDVQQGYDTRTLAPTRRYLSGPGQDAVAIAPDGTLAAGARGAPNVTVYRAGGRSPVNRFSQTGYQVGLAPSGLAWSADSRTLFAVYQYPVLKNGGVSSHAYRVFAYRDPQRTASTITLRGTTETVFGHRVSITGRVTLSVGGPPAGSRITITRRLPGRPTVVIRWARVVGPRGYFSLTDTPQSPGTYTYTFSYPGTAALAPATAIRRVVITRIPTAMSLTASAGPVNYRSAVTVTAHLRRALAGQIVLVYARSFGSKTEHLLSIGLVNAGGELSVRYTPTYSTTFTAVFRGDADYQPAIARRTVSVRAGVGESISGYTGSAYVGSTLYRVYQQTNTLRAAASVAPAEKGCVAFQIDQYLQGSWQYDTISACVKLTAASRAGATFGLSDVPGGQFRIRADFRRARDTTNVNGDSRWSYFLVVS